MSVDVGTQRAALNYSLSFFPQLFSNFSEKLLKSWGKDDNE